MNSRQLRAIFAALAVLVVAYVAVQAWSTRGGASGDDSIPAAVRDGLSLVRVTGPGETDSLRIESDGEAWTVNGYPADTSMVRRLREAGIDSKEPPPPARTQEEALENHDWDLLARAFLEVSPEIAAGRLPTDRDALRRYLVALGDLEELSKRIRAADQSIEIVVPVPDQFLDIREKVGIGLTPVEERDRVAS